MKKNIGNVSYKKRLTNKIRSARSPLIMGRREWAENRGIEWKLERFMVIWVLEAGFREGEYT
jgi:hypothetical protein